MDNLLIDLEWEKIGSTVLLIVSVIMIFLLRRPSSDSQQALKLGVCFFVFSFFLNTIGSTKIADYFSVLGFIIIAIALVCLFWSDTRKLE